tara:strand:- start:2336 stop:2941 length:606 start_codon:yes stop_codon:yes gene_type:complete
MYYTKREEIKVFGQGGVIKRYTVVCRAQDSVTISARLQENGKQCSSESGLFLHKRRNVIVELNAILNALAEESIEVEGMVAASLAESIENERMLAVSLAESIENERMLAASLDDDGASYGEYSESSESDFGDYDDDGASYSAYVKFSESSESIFGDYDDDGASYGEFSDTAIVILRGISGVILMIYTPWIDIVWPQFGRSG